MYPVPAGKRGEERRRELWPGGDIDKDAGDGGVTCSRSGLHSANGNSGGAGLASLLVPGAAA